MKSVPRLYLGTMTFGWTKQTSSIVDLSVATQMLEVFREKGGIIHVDTARIYAGGQSEVLLGQAIGNTVKEDDGSSIKIGTKAHPSQPGGLSEKGIRSQLKASIESLQSKNVKMIDEYYLHQPDTEHSLLTSLSTLHDLVQEGKIQRIGLSNYHVTEVERAFELCREHHLTPPSVYQGLYNPLNRMVETSLLPLLKQNNCQFVAYNPLAAGLLTGKHQPDEVQQGRFRDNPNYLPRFYTEANFRAVQIIQEALVAENNNISILEATFRWLLHHSALDMQDGILLGASSLQQLQENLDATAFGAPLSNDVLAAFDKAWAVTEAAGAFPYWRSYSSDMPERENLDQGASYSAATKK